MRPFFLAALILLPCSIWATDPAVWSAVILATNEEKPKEMPAELRMFKQKLQNVFGYNQFELIGQHTEPMDDPSERWLIPSKNFSVRVGSKSEQKNGYAMNLELFEDQRMLARFDAHLGAQSPLFIRGPMYAGGQVIILMMVK
ncbi:MAG: hypothetical protein QOD99_2256 [Chthoniobacter sp.]|jgi:hypothetical protein|nr:hypothetical protein [Chthoniobacter sp.]